MSKPATAVPQPRPLPLIGNVTDVDKDTPVQSLMKLADAWGPIFRMQFPTRDFFVVSGADLVDELCDETRFRKLVHGPLLELRPMAGKGLFTAETSDPEWGKAHRILMPAFGPQSVRDYFGPMLDIAEQLIVKWERLGEKVDHDVADNMTRLTLDTIALCGFGYRFNSYYQPEMHPFIDAMVRALAEASVRTRQLPLQTRLKVLSQRHFETDIAYMNEVVDELIRERKSGATRGERDLLSLMLDGRDPVTGEGLDDLNIRQQMVTFLIAGHETTSGLLSFALYELLRHPEVLAKARAEVDAVLGTATPRFEHLSRLTWVDQVLRETLRLWPTAPAFAVTPVAPTRLGDVLDVVPGDDLLVLIPTLHRDSSVWGGDAERFDPERFAPGRRESIPPNAWKPFGTGQRACIGRPFAMQEATLVLAMLLQRFDLVPGDYQLTVKETLTLKPEGLRMRVRSRGLERAPAQVLSLAPTVTQKPSVVQGHGTPLTVLFGSNTGASEAFARRIAGDAAQRGYAVDVRSMNAAVNALPTKGALVVVTASYNGKPPDNAQAFCDWLDGVPAGSLAGLPYVVFGCGHRDWAATYQAVPTRVDAALARAGGRAVVTRGEADARADFFGDFESWYPALWPTVDATLNVQSATTATSALYAVTSLAAGPTTGARAQGYVAATVEENRELVAPGGRSKRHLSLRLPEGVVYRCGDYLSVLAENPAAVVQRAARRFGLELDAVVQLSSGRPSAASLPLERPVSVHELLSAHVELSQPATRRQVELLAAATRCPPEKQQLVAWAGDATAYRTQVLDKRVSVLELLERCPACELTFAGFLELLPPLKPRLYSISSSPLVEAGRCTLTVAVLDAPALSGRGRHLGVASSFLGRAAVGDRVWVAVKEPNTPFRLPESQLTPVLMVAAGSGLAPFRGFLEERATRRARGEAVGAALLYFGCDDAAVDFLYREELAQWEAAGVVSVRPTFCLKPEGERVYVQHRLWEERDEVRALLAKGAKVFICGDGARMAPAVRETLSRILEAEGGLVTLEREGRLVADVFS